MPTPRVLKSKNPDPITGEHDAKEVATSARVQINNSIYADAIVPSRSSSTAPEFDEETNYVVMFEPQAVFRVRTVGRCSATLSGELMRNIMYEPC